MNLRLPAVLALLHAAAPFDARAADPKPGLLLLYDGWGTPNECTISGRVLVDKRIREPSAERTSLDNLADTLKTFESDEVPGAVVEVEIGARKVRGVTDRDGNFEVVLRATDAPLPVGRVSALARLVEDQGHPAPPAEGVVHVIADEPGVAVISDFDDTLVKTHVLSKRKLIETTLLKNAAQIETVEGAPRALQLASEEGARAFFYLSGSPQNFHARIFYVLDRHKFPRGPILLKNIGSDHATAQEGYKTARLLKLIDALPKLRFVLVGDTGEADPEIYRAIAKDRPGRIAGIVIRRTPKSRFDGRRLEGTIALDDYAKRPDVIARLVAPE